MPDSAAAYNDSDNLVTDLNDDENQMLAHLISKRFANATDELRTLTDYSREAWDFLLKNRPDPSMLANKVASKFDTLNTNTSRQGMRLGMIPKTVDTVLSILHNSMFPPDEKFFRGTPKNVVARESQELYEQYRSDNFAEDNTKEKLRQFILTLCMDPAACIALPWKTKTRKKIVWEAPKLVLGGIEIPLPVLGLKKKTINDFVEWEGTAVEPLDWNDWRVDPSARSLEDSWFIRRWYEPVWKVKKDYDLKDDVPAYTDAYNFIDDVQGNRKATSSGLIQPIPPGDEEDGKKQALLMVCYDDFVISGEVYENHVAVVLNGLKVVWFGPNPYNHGRLPYAVTSLFPIPNQIYGRSLVLHAIPSAAVMDTVVDKLCKIGALAADPIFEVDMMEPAFRKSQPVKPGMTIPVKRVGQAIRQVQVQIVNLTALYQLLEKMEENIRDVTGVSQVIAGEDFNQPANITAFQVDQHVQGASSKFQAMMNNLKTTLELIVYIAFENDKQYKSQSETVYIGEDETELTPDLIKQMEFKWLITSTDATNTRGKRLANRRALVTEILPALLQSGLAMPVPGGISIDVFEAVKGLAILGGETDADLIFKKIPPPPPQPMGDPNGLPGLPETQPGGPGQLPGATTIQPPIPGAQGQVA